VYRLQRKGVSLDLQQALMQPTRPLWGAWLAFLTQQAMGQPTYVLYDPHDGEAFVQVRYRPHQSAADIVWLAPELSDRKRTAHAWSCLLDGVSVEAGGQGIQRVFASLPASGAEIEVFQQAGFAVYAGEDIYRRLPQVVALGEEPLPDLRPQLPNDWPALQKLCVAITPQRVRQAEGGIGLPLSWEKHCRRYVLSSKENDDLLAAVMVCAGAQAHWLRVLLHPDALHLAQSLVRWGLAMLVPSGQPPKLTYCNIHHFENSLQDALEAAEFKLHATRALMVKHTLAWIKSPVPEAVAALKGSTEPLPPTYRIKSGSDMSRAKGLSSPDGWLASEEQLE
jgi:hypothetical protein